MFSSSASKLPFGNLPRLLLAWLCTEAVRTQSRVLILGSSLSDFMDKLGMAPVGGARTRLRNQMDRLFNAHVSLIYEDECGKATVNSLIADSTAFWWNPRRPDQPSLWDSKIELSEKFFNEIIRHPVPLDMNILTALKRSTLGLDLYRWLTYRTFALRAPLRLTWKHLYRQFGAHPAKASDNNTVQAFRYTGISFIALRRLQVYIRLPPSSPPSTGFLPEGPTGSQPPFYESQELIAWASRTSFFRYLSIPVGYRNHCLGCRRLGYPEGSDSPSIRPSMLANSRRLRWLSANNNQ